MLHRSLLPLVGLLALFWSIGSVGQGTSPAEQPLPDIDSIVSDPRRALVLDVLVEADVASLLDSYVSATPPAGYRGAPAQLRLRWFDGSGIRIGTRYAWNPRWEFERDGDEEQRNLLASAVEGFAIPFDKNLARVTLTDLDSGLMLLDADVTNTVQGFCIANPDDPNCDGVSIVDRDDDGVPDATDNCPDDANSSQADADNDGIGDVCDSTPNGEVVAGDINGDLVIDTRDYNAIRAALGKCDGDTGYLSVADYTGDHCVAYDDYQFWYQAYYAPPSPGPGC